MNTICNGHAYAVIMAGGGGTRLWPLSRKDRPKQVLQLFGDRTLFQMAIDRLSNLFELDHIKIVTAISQKQQLMDQIPALANENFILEPSPKGTATVIALASVHLKHLDPDAIMVTLTADHLIQNTSQFENAIRESCVQAAKGHLVTLGIPPSFPSTGYGYIERDHVTKKKKNITFYRVKAFKEKPDFEKAKLFVNDGDHYWNSGMFIWTVNSIQEEFSRQMPELIQAIHSIMDADSSEGSLMKNKDTWEAIAPQTIDYGIMEHARNVVVGVVPELGWSDIGSWDSLVDLYPKDQNNNSHIGKNILFLNTNNTLAFSESSDKLLVLIGVEDMIVVETENALLVCRKSQAQEVKRVVNLLNEKKLQQFS